MKILCKYMMIKIEWTISLLIDMYVCMDENVNDNNVNTNRLVLPNTIIGVINHVVLKNMYHIEILFIFSAIAVMSGISGWLLMSTPKCSHTISPQHALSGIEVKIFLFKFYDLLVFTHLWNMSNNRCMMLYL